MQTVWQCQTLSSNFRNAAKLIQRSLPALKSHEILVKNKLLGINASDINYSAGRYDPKLEPPFDLGFEALGEIVAKGNDVPHTVKEGSHVIYSKYGAFANVVPVNVKGAFPIPSLDPGFLPLFTSGLTASISLEQVGRIGAVKASQEIVLVTAAAGGTGQFAVQCAKIQGCHVIGTTSSEDKAVFLRGIGCDRVINYKTENLRDVLKKDYPDGVDCVFESVGGAMFDVALDALALKGRLIVIGFIADYQTERGVKPNAKLSLLPAKLLKKSASVGGFFLPYYTGHFERHFRQLAKHFVDGKLTSRVDAGFEGLESVPDAIEYLHSGKSVGKVAVRL